MLGRGLCYYTGEFPLLLVSGYGCGVVGFEDAAFGRADELYYLVADFALGELCHNDVASHSVGVTILEEHAEDILNLLNLLIREAPAPQTQEVGTNVGDGGVGCLNIGRNIFVHIGVGGNHCVVADAAELVSTRVTTEDHIVAEFYLAGE